MRLEEIASAQAERGEALIRLRRGVVVGVAILGGLLFATASGGVALYQANAALGRARASLGERDSALNSAQAELQLLVRRLGQAREEISNQASRLSELSRASASAEQLRDTQAELAATQEELRSIHERAVAVEQTVFWDSPAGPVLMEFGPPLQTEEPDRTDDYRFSTKTRF